MVGDAELLHRDLDLAAAVLPETVVAVGGQVLQVGHQDLAHLAGRAGDQGDPAALRDVLRHRGAVVDGLVVGVGVDQEEPVLRGLAHTSKRNDGPMRRSLIPVLALTLVGASLTGCGLFGGSSSLDDALEVVPSSVDQVIFFDRAAAVERLGLDELDADPSEEELHSYVEGSRELPYFTTLDSSVVQMLDTAPFSAQDVDWEVTIYEGDDGFGRVWRMNDDLDLDDVADELVDSGFEEESGEGRSLSIDLEEIGTDKPYLIPMQTVTLLPDDHLIVTGPLADDVLEVIADDADSAVDDDTFEDLVDSTDDVEVAQMARDDKACQEIERLSPEQLEASGIDELGHPEETGFFVHGDEADVRSVLLFDDDDAAEEDAEAREDFLADGSSPVSGVPYEEFAEWEIDTDGKQERIDLDYDDPQDVSAVISRGDFVSVCAPE